MKEIRFPQRISSIPICLEGFIYVLYIPGGDPWIYERYLVEIEFL